MYDYSKYKGFKLSDADYYLLRNEDGHPKMQKLFKEYTQHGEVPLYTLKDYEYRGYPSAYMIYMASVDEYDAAMKLVGSMSHWRQLITLGWFQKGILSYGFSGLNQWREDMALRDMSSAKKIIQDALLGEKFDKDGKSYTVSDHNAAKKLIDIAKNPATPDNIVKESRAKRIKDVDVSPERAKILELHKKVKG